jgi:glycosyltransferase involved in cell wall biosynthesis
LVTAIRKRLRAVIHATIGELVIFEFVHSVLDVRSAIRNRLFERAEVRRLGAGAICAEIVTIIPTYKRPELLALAVRSALDQDVPDHAVIVISDGDDVAGVLPSDPRLHVHRLTRNIGVAGVVRNVGIRASTSRYIAFLDDDNQWLPGHLNALVEALDGGADYAYTGLIRILDDGREFDRLLRPFVRRNLRNENYVDVNTVVVRRSRRVRFSRRTRRALEAPGEDWVFIWRLSRRSRPAVVERYTVRYLVNPKSFFWPGHAERAQRMLDQAAGPSS